MIQSLAPIKNIINALKAAKNPQAYIQEMIAADPNMKKAINYINANGGDPKKAFYKLAQENGLNPEEILHGIL